MHISVRVHSRAAAVAMLLARRLHQRLHAGARWQQLLRSRKHRECLGAEKENRLTGGEQGRERILGGQPLVAGAQRSVGLEHLMTGLRAPFVVHEGRVLLREARDGQQQLRTSIETVV